MGIVLEKNRRITRTPAREHVRALPPYCILIVRRCATSSQRLMGMPRISHGSTFFLSPSVSSSSSSSSFFSSFLLFAIDARTFACALVRALYSKVTLVVGLTRVFPCPLPAERSAREQNSLEYFTCSGLLEDERRFDDCLCYIICLAVCTQISKFETLRLDQN